MYVRVVIQNIIVRWFDTDVSGLPIGPFSNLLGQLDRTDR
jgi:hypothetical protein